MSVAALHAHLATGLTHVCQCWAIKRLDGVTFGFTDHDRDLSFEGVTFSADSGMSARALAASTGLSVNNSEAVGLLKSTVIREEDIAAGRYDGAEVTMWQVCWDDVTAREVKFVGTIGEVKRRSGTFEAELRGLTEALNQPQGRSFLRSCSAVLGDAACGVDLNDPQWTLTATISAVNGAVLQVADNGFDDAWFEGGRLEVLTGEAAGLSALVKRDLVSGGNRQIDLWEPLRQQIIPGDSLRLVAGCDRMPVTCRQKFANFLNFQGFPDIPGEDWLVSVPRSDAPNSGGSLKS